ncbi:MAG: GDP-L-fucose synthase [Longimicrobiales bacterium]|nr:GDP-L-fucose synthase [Longimicrobiales bacterium]
MDASSAIFVAGHRGMVGSAIVRRLHSAGYENLVLRTRSELDLTDASATREFFEEARPEYVFLAAAKVGGILANDSCPADFIRENLSIQTSVIHSAWESGVRKLLFLGSSCIYPKHAPQPMAEELLLTGPLETTNDAYAVAKIAGIKMCEAYRRQHGSSFISAMPTNLYGPGDNFDEKGSHVLPGLIRRFDTAKKDGLESVAVWGSGTPRREFLHVDDLADACLFLMLQYDGEGHVNVGVGEDISILGLAELVKSVVGYRGEIRLDSTKPDGTPRKLLDVSLMESLGWSSRIGLRDGIETTYAWYTESDPESIRSGS